ncbi:hypothetical protein FUA23_16220 [Neolewinella aurantiaca]|uniref:Calcineurin-like phosphoesterase domain-containing protein n=1 Tax=Neolewinella aurantiaca TaxID=2602767 RepID=A0A5C7FPZ3_9BACT|nr:metallophosphoesterase [Neolewinella aurantiaca]TXF88027.1 hypothetical protein FUA23_16220 [Neolewinella aurantiaca]
MSHFLALCLRRTLSFFVFVLLAGCASYQVQLDEAEKNWAEINGPGTRVLAHKTYLIGDAGNARSGEVPPVLSYLKTELSAAPANSTAIFLGDNIYPGGFPPPDHPEREIAEHRLIVQTNAVANYPGRVLWVPGNHDWYRFGLEGLKEQRRFLRAQTGRKNIWLPKVNCGGPEVVEAHENLVYIIIDTQWYLANWKKHPGVNEGCAASNRTEFIRLFREAVKKNKEKQIVVVMHHPMETYGRHGGHFTLKDHLSPLPVIGSVVPFVRGNIGTSQDNLNARFQELRKKMLSAVKLNGNATFVSGHDHNLQYIEKDRQRYIVSGAASKTAPSGMGDGSRFAYGGRGYGELDLYEDGSLWLSFFTVNDAGTAKELLYRKEIAAPRAADLYEPPASYTDYPITRPTLKAQLVREDYNVGKFGRFFLGDHYRDAYDMAVDIPLLDLSTFKGGLEPVKVGSGTQTVSLRLVAEDGREYTMRSLEKDPTSTLGLRLSRSRIVQALVADGFTAAHPIGALPVIGMAKAVGINHTNPGIYYVPAQPALGKYNPAYGEKVYLLEERPDDEDWRSYADFGKPQDIRSTDQALKSIRTHPDHLIDFRAVARARAFDLLLGDWDRQDDQWRWKVEKREDGRTYYVPIPRDRDQVFSNYDGLLLGIARRIVPDVAPLRPFVANPQKVGISTRGARFFDATFMAGVNRDMLMEETKHLQEKLTDRVIDMSFQKVWPDEMMELDGNKIVSILKLRRNNLRRIVEDYYDFRAREVEITGSDTTDLFQIDVLSGGDVRVQVFGPAINSLQEGRACYDRTFLADETRELILYGLRDQDKFVFNGAGKPGMIIRIVGGPDEDTVAYGPGGDKVKLGKVFYYDYKARTEASLIAGVRGMRDKRASAARYNIYSRLSENKDYDFFSLLPILGSNPDNGLLLGAIATKTTYGFKKEPFASRQVLNGRYAAATNGFRFAYRGEFTDVFGDRELLIESKASTSLFGVNFYGFGNETVNNEETEPLGRDYNRVRQQYVQFSPQVLRRLNPAASYSYGPSYSVVETDRIPGRFLAENSDDQSDEGIFSNYHYLGLNGRFTFDNRIPSYLPGRGIRFLIEGGYQLSLYGPGEDFFTFRTNLTFNQQVDDYGDLIIANRVGYHHVFADDLAYFQAATLGGSGELPNFRGFRRERFSGNQAFYFNSDIRYRILSSRNSRLPFSLGVIAGYDLGRVWLEGERSNKWHYSYGGGFFISPLDYATVSFSYFIGDGEIGRFSFGTGFFF